MLAAIGEQCNAIEECYEFMLAYAAQGLPTDEGSESGGRIREFLGRAVKAVTALIESCTTAAERDQVEPAAPHRAFMAVLDRDARHSLAALELVLAQPSISSQLIDNLNASIHLRALLTDLFLLGDIARALRTSPVSALATSG
jgi:hypothetical protein